MDLDNLIFGFLLALIIGLILVRIDNEQAKEVELIKNTKDYVIHQNCVNLNGEWYCYD